MANLMPGEWDIMTQDAARKRKFADMLRQQREPQGQMVSGYYVPPSWTQRLASVLNQYQAGQMNRQAEEQERGAIQKQRETYQSAGQRLAEALRGKQADPNDATMPGATGYQPASMDDIQNAQIQYAQDIGEPQAMQQAVQGIIAQRNQAQLRNDDREFRTQSREDEQAFRAEQDQLQREARAQSLAQQIAAREQAGRDSADLRRELVRMQMQNSRDMASMRTQGNPYYTPVQTANGVMSFDARTGRAIPLTVDGKPVIGAQADPGLQGAIAGAKETGKATAEAKMSLPRDVSQAEQTIGLVDDLLKHPGFESAVGFSSYNPLNKVAGQPGNDFNIRLDQLKGQQFLQAFQSLKGGGQITEVEGKKATDAISRMNSAASEKEFRQAAKEFQDVIRTGVNRAREKAGAAPAENRVRRYNPQTGRIE